MHPSQPHGDNLGGRLDGGAVQLGLPGPALDPDELAGLTAPERGRIYAALGLGPLLIAGLESEARAVIAKRYRGAA